MGINWSMEWPQIKQAADEYGVDPLFIAAIRHTENGGPGREFGVLSEPTEGYEGQLRAACGTLRHRLTAYLGNPLDTMQAPAARRVIYRKDFIQWFAYGDEKNPGWAPKAAANDPTNLNLNWSRNASIAYFSFVALGKVQ